MRYIDADALNKWIDDSIAKFGNTYSIDMLNMFSLFKHVIDKAPTVKEKSYAMGYQDGAEDGLQEIRPHGKWIEDYKADEHPAFRRGWKCSYCGFRSGYGMPPFCMWCGAKMEGGEHG